MNNFHVLKIRLHFSNFFILEIKIPFSGLKSKNVEGINISAPISRFSCTSDQPGGWFTFVW